MPRAARLDVGGYPYHVINRAVMRLEIFTSPSDYHLFEKLLGDIATETGVRILAYCLMPNHWHLLLHPENDGDLGIFMHRLTSSHTRQFRAETGTNGTGPLYQGRYKSFVIDDDIHLLTVLKYFERNAVRAKLANTAESWRWGSAWQRFQPKRTVPLALLPTPLPADYLSWLNAAEPNEALNEVRTSVNKGRPFGRENWVSMTVDKFKLGSTMREPGRPRK